MLWNSFSPIYNRNTAEYYLLQRLYLVKRGRFTWTDIMNMPIWEKNFYYNKLIALQEEEAERK